ncbi:MAG: phosphoribosylformylglycinamidine synthase subunit PurS [Methanobacterium sp. PtaB.Bin024]|jgi:phosphoribosylformylglycinamidine synthase|nr:MAG: phosphoribosylformylglycinamidine synthase subunit PurS [Methanobacterium sp. PtaB.Bin024]
MKYNAKVEISLKKGMLNPEASTIQRALALLDYQVKDTSTMETIKFTLEAEDPDAARNQVVEMCERLLCNPVIHDYQIQINQTGD